MGNYVSYILFREGRSDNNIARVLERLLIWHGADEVQGVTDSKPGSTSSKLRTLLDRDAEFDIAFVHRDSDAKESATRRREVVEAATELNLRTLVIPVIPVHETEAWILSDPEHLARVIGCDSESLTKACPPLRNIENLANPKEVLEGIVDKYSPNNKRRGRGKNDFGIVRSRALGSLDINGPVSRVKAFSCLANDIREALKHR